MAVYSGEPAATEPGAASSHLVTHLALRFGGGAGLLCGLWMLGLQLTGSNGFGPKQILAQLLVPLAALAAEWVLRQRVKPARPGLGRALGVGTLTALLAATVSALCLVGLAYGVGEPALARHRTEMVEIVRAQQRENPKAVISEPLRRQQIQAVESLTVTNMATSNFLQVLVIGLVLAVPAGIFLRE